MTYHSTQTEKKKRVLFYFQKHVEVQSNLYAKTTMEKSGKIGI